MIHTTIIDLIIKDLGTKIERKIGIKYFLYFF